MISDTAGSKPVVLTAAERANQRNAVIAGFLGWTLDAFDFFVLTFVIDDVAKAFGKTRPDIALTITLALVMRPIGAIIFGLMADRIGRRIPMMINILFFAVLSAASGLAPNYQTFLILRMLFGIALGGQWGVGASLALETVPVRLRGILSGLLQQGYSTGNLLAAIAFRVVYPMNLGLADGDRWRVLFLLGGLPALLSLFIFTKVKESPVWHENKTDWPTYFRTALQAWPRFLFFVALMMMVGLMAHGTQDMYPTFLKTVHKFPPKTVANVTIMSMIGASFGGILGGWLSDQIGRRRSMVIMTLGGLATVPLWIGAPTLPWLIVGGMLIQFFVQGMAGVVPAHMNELTPGKLRGFFPGLAYQVGIVCASIITYLEAFFGERFSYTTAMGLLVGLIFISACFVFGLGPENKGASFGKNQSAGH